MKLFCLKLPYYALTAHYKAEIEANQKNLEICEIFGAKQLTS